MNKKIDSELVKLTLLTLQNSQSPTPEVVTVSDAFVETFSEMDVSKKIFLRLWELLKVLLPGVDMSVHD